MEEKALISSNNEYLINQITDLLKDNEIPYIIRTEGTGNYRRITYGRTSEMTTIYVSNEDLDRASKVIEILDSIYGNDKDLSDTIPDEFKEIEEEKDYNDKYNKKIGMIRHLFVFGLLLIILVMIVILSINN